MAVPTNRQTNDTITATDINDIATLANANESGLAGLVIGTDVQAYSVTLQNTTASFTTADETKLDGIEPLADVTDEANVTAALDGATLTDIGTPDSADRILIQDNSAAGELKTVDASALLTSGAAVTSGAGAPSSTPSNVGDIYIDTTADEAYIATGTVSSADWDAATTDPGSGSTNLGYTASTRTVTSDTGSDAVLTEVVAAGNSGLMTGADKTKLDGIEPLADVTDATNVDAAGAVMNSDTATTAMSFVVDEDDMASNSATKVPTQQSVKAYADVNALSIKSYTGFGATLSLVLTDAGKQVTAHHITPTENCTVNLPTWATGHPGWMTLQVRNNGAGYTISFGFTNWVLEPNVNLSRTPQPTFFMNWDPVASKWRVSDIGIDAVADLGGASLTDAGAPAATDQVLIKDAATGALQTADFSDFAGSSYTPDGTYQAVTHSSAGILTLNFNDSDRGWKVTMSANITDIQTSNGPSSGSMKSRLLEIVATGSGGTVASTTTLADGSLPSSMASGDKWLGQVVEIV